MEAGFVAESEPSAPYAVFALVGGFLARIQDDSAICRACVMKDKISSGSGKIVKSSGMS